MIALRRFIYSKLHAYCAVPTRSVTEVNLKQCENSVLLDMLIDPKTNLKIKPFIYKESYYRIPTMNPADMLQLFRLFVDSKVPKHICINTAQAIAQKIDLLTEKEIMEILYIIFYSSKNIVIYSNIVMAILRKIDPKLITPEFLMNMWMKSTHRFASVNPFRLIIELARTTISKLNVLTDAQLLKILTHHRNVKVSNGRDIEAIHSDIITNRRNRHDLMAALTLFLMDSLRYDRDIIVSYLDVITQALEEGNISPPTITLASVIAKQNFVRPKIYEDLEPHVVNFCLENNLHESVAYSYLYACVIADYFPKKFIQLYLTPDRITALTRDVIKSPFMKSGAEVCTVVDYARVKGVDLGLSDEILKLVEKLAYSFCKKAWEFHCNELNPWENRANALVGRQFPLYVSWPTKAGYFIDTCMFFDDDCKSLSLDKAASVLSQKQKSSCTFDRSGLENKPTRSMVDFNQIWSVINNQEILKDIPNKIVLEFNGPYHFLRPLIFRGRSPIHYRVEGATMLRRKYLQASGWEYIGVPFFQYEKRASTAATSLGPYIQSIVNHIIGSKQAAKRY